MVAFPLLSGRICEVLTRSDWILNMGGQLFDIPDLPVEEIGRLARSIRDAVECVPVTVPHQLGDPSTGYITITIPLVLWTNAATGRADVYSPLTGFVQGQQLLDPQAQLSGSAPRASADDLEIDISSGGTLPSGNA